MCDNNPKMYKVRDEWTGRIFMSNEQTIREGFMHAHAIFLREGDLSYNDLMDHLGLSPVMAGDKVGWSDEAPEPIIKADTETGPRGLEPVLTLEFRPQPRNEFSV